METEQEQEPEPTPSYPRLVHQGQAQFQLNDGSLGAARPNFVPAQNGLAPFPADSRLYFRRIRPSWQLEFSPSFLLDTEFQITPQEEQIEVLDLLFRYNFSPETALSAGRFKVPFGWEGLRTSAAINTVERSDVTVYCYPERDIGLMLSHQQPGLGEFSVGTFMGQPRNQGEPNGGLDLIGRATFQPAEELSLGLSGHAGTFRPERTNLDLPVRRLGAELQWNPKPFALEAEAIWSDGYNTASQRDTRAFGYYITGIYQVDKSLDIVLNYDRFDPDLDVVSLTRPDNASNSRDRKLIGLNYYFSRDPIHRVMLNYEMHQSLQGPAFDTNGFRLRYQIGW